MPSFGELLSSHIQRLEISQAEFARRVGVSGSAISSFISGESAPRPSKAPRWVAALHLDGEEARAFVLAWDLALSPESVRKLVEDQRRFIERLTRRK